MLWKSQTQLLLLPLCICLSWSSKIQAEKGLSSRWRISLWKLTRKDSDLANTLYPFLCYGAAQPLTLLFCLPIKCPSAESLCARPSSPGSRTYMPVFPARRLVVTYSPGGDVRNDSWNLVASCTTTKTASPSVHNNRILHLCFCLPKAPCHP